jgi:hypothetical protein
VPKFFGSAGALPSRFLRAMLSFTEETLVMMQLSESGFQEWLEEGEDIYDAEA